MTKKAQGRRNELVMRVPESFSDRGSRPTIELEWVEGAGKPTEGLARIVLGGSV